MAGPLCWSPPLPLEDWSRAGPLVEDVRLDFLIKVKSFPSWTILSFFLFFFF